MGKRGILGDMFDINGDGELDFFEEIMELEYLDEDIEDITIDDVSYDDFEGDYDEY